MPLGNLYKRIRALQQFDIVAECEKIINGNSQFLAELLKKQLAEGKDGDGELIKAKYGTFYADSTIKNKELFGEGLGKRVDVVTLYMTGNFYAYIHIVTKKEKFEFNSDIPYFTDIITRSGTKIMDLNKEHLELFSKEILIPQLRLAYENFEKNA